MGKEKIQGGEVREVPLGNISTLSSKEKKRKTKTVSKHIYTYIYI